MNGQRTAASDQHAGLVAGGRVASWTQPQPKLVLVDVDGTLLSTKERTSVAVAQAVARCREVGLYVGLATGRSADACRGLIDGLRLTGPHILFNGAQILANGCSVTSRLTPEAVVAVRDVAASFGSYLELYTSDGFWVTDARAAIRPHWETMRSEPEGHVAECDPSEVFKATLVTFPGDDLGDLIGRLSEVELHAEPSFAPAVPHATFVNITAPGVDKGTSLSRAIEASEVTEGETVVIGDGPNDLALFDVAGTAIAMGDAASSVRERAHLIAPAFAVDGAAVALLAASAWRRSALGGEERAEQVKSR